MLRLLWKFMQSKFIFVYDKFPIDNFVKTDYNRHITNAMKGNKTFVVFPESCRMVRGSKMIMVIAPPWAVGWKITSKLERVLPLQRNVLNDADEWAWIHANKEWYHGEKLLRLFYVSKRNIKGTFLFYPEK